MGKGILVKNWSNIRTGEEVPVGGKGGRYKGVKLTDGEHIGGGKRMTRGPGIVLCISIDEFTIIPVRVDLNFKLLS